MKKIKTILFLLLIPFSGAVSAHQNILDTIIELRKTSYIAKDLFQELISSHKVPMAFGNSPGNHRIEFAKKTQTLHDILTKSLKDTDFSYQIRNGKVLIIPKNTDGKATISGFVRDEESGESLIGATIQDQFTGNGAISNTYGFFSLTLTNAPANLQISYVGFSPMNLQFELNRDTVINALLTPSTNKLEEVLISSDENQVESTKMSNISLSREDLEIAPMLLGERDVLKTLQLLPGVKSGSEGSSGVYVRGGGADQNLILLDGVPVYNASHLFGFLSVFNSDAINKVELMKGGFPARYGGRLSSVIDIAMKEGNVNESTGKASIGLIASKFTIEGPIKNRKTSYIFSARRTYIDALARPFLSPEDANFYHFMDFNAKVNHRFSDKDHIFLSFYGGRDKFKSAASQTVFAADGGILDESNTESGIKWGNIVSVLRWNHLFGPKLFANLSANVSQYGFTAFDQTSTFYELLGRSVLQELNYKSGIRDFTARLDLDYQHSPRFGTKFGGFLTNHQFNTGILQFVDDEQQSTTVGNDETSATEAAIYMENDIKFGDLVSVNIGIHTSAFRVNNRTYNSLQPRFSSNISLSKQLSLKASYSEMTQYIHLLSNTGIGLPTDLWVPATDRVRPQQSRQVAAGFVRVSDKYEVTLEGYYKDMENLIAYENGASYIATDVGWENKIVIGKGESYGAELLLRKKSGRVNGWVSYTWAKSSREFSDINFGRPFPFRYDRRHEIKTIASYELKENVTLSGTWIFGTGNPTTLATSTYLGTKVDPNFENPFHSGDKVENIESRNNYRMRNYHRLDANISWKKPKKRGVRTWSLGAYNLYNRKNPFFIYIDEYAEDGAALKQVSLFPFIPSINYSFDF